MKRCGKQHRRASLFTLTLMRNGHIRMDYKGKY